MPILPREFYPMVQLLLLQFGVAIAAGWLSYPFDTLHRRIIIAAGAKNPSLKYRSTYHAFVQIVQNEGITALFQGAGTNIVRSITSSFVLVAFDHAARYL